jgi:tetratricopeptide (TPR) repeat protein
MRHIATISLIMLLGLPATGFADGGGGGSTSPATKSCKKGEVWDGKKKVCVKIQSGIIPDTELYEQGSALARDGEYEWAIEVLAAARNQNDPKILNYTGYCHRKAGRLETGIGFYRKALAIDPGFVLAREYLGEGYAAMGRIDLAQAELAEIARRCGITCEEYKDLAEAISAASN